MAEIDIVPKQSSRAWVWVILVIALIAVAYWFMNRQPASSSRVDRGGAPQALNYPGPVSLTPELTRLAG